MSVISVTTLLDREKRVSEYVPLVGHNVVQAHKGLPYHWKPLKSWSLASGVSVMLRWQGRESSQDEIGASALLAKEMDDKLNDAAVQVRHTTRGNRVWPL